MSNFRNLKAGLAMCEFKDFTAPMAILYDREASKLLGKDHWQVNYGFRYYTHLLGGAHYVAIDHGYLTDGASVPRLFWNILPPWGEYGQAAVVHDWLCENLFVWLDVDGVPTRVDITRKQADKILLEAMRELEVEKWKRAVMYAGITIYRVYAQPNSPTINPLKLQLETARFEHLAA